MSEQFVPAPTGSRAAQATETLRQLGHTFPEAHEDYPWGHLALKVRSKMFLILGPGPDGLAVTMKLPDSGHEALLLPFTEPTGYGMGKHGWVTSRFGVDEVPPVAILAGWIEESYRAIAPKALVAVLDGVEPNARRKKA